eukprot:SAG31_NODE_8643_length_1414_cov_20.155894_2_plen_31_part_01
MLVSARIGLVPPLIIDFSFHFRELEVRADGP